MPSIGGSELITPTPASSVVITIDPGTPNTIAAWTAGQAETLSINGTPMDGQELTLIITNDGTVRSITFGTGLKAISNLSGVINRKAVISFIAYNGVFYERSRAVSLIT